MFAEFSITAAQPAAEKIFASTGTLKEKIHSIAVLLNAAEIATRCILRVPSDAAKAPELEVLHAHVVAAILKRLKTDGVMLATVVGSEFGNAVHTCTPPVNVPEILNSGAAIVRYIDEYVQSGDYEGFTPAHVHEAAMDSLSNDLSGYVNQSIDFTRTTFLPTVNNIFQRVTDEYRSLTPRFWNIVRVRRADIFLNDYIIDGINRYVAAKGLDQTKIPETTFPDVEISLLVSRIKTDIPTVDAAIIDYLGNYPLTKLENVYRRHIQQKFPLGLDTDEDDAMMMYLLLNGLGNDPLEGTKSVSESAYKAAMETLKARAAVAIKRLTQSYENALQSGNIVHRVDTGNRTIYVINETYENYINNGGKPEAVMGAVMLRGDGELLIANTTNLNDAKIVSRALARYERDLITERNALSRNAQSLLGQAIVGNLVNAYRKLDRTLTAGVAEQHVYNTARDYLTNTAGVDVVNKTYEVIQYLVATLIFPTRQSLALLDKLNGYSTYSDDLRVNAYRMALDLFVDTIFQDVVMYNSVEG